MKDDTDAYPYIVDRCDGSPLHWLPTGWARSTALETLMVTSHQRGGLIGKFKVLKPSSIGPEFSGFVPMSNVALVSVNGKK